MSQEQNINTLNANTTPPNTTNLNHTRSPKPTPAQGAPALLFSPRISPAPNPDFPRRSSSLQPSSPGAPSSKTTDTSIQPSESMANAGRQDQVGDGTTTGEEQQVPNGSEKTGMDNAKEKIEEFDWEGLEERFWGKMEECRKVEEGIMGEFAELLEVFNAWTAAGAAGEEERAGKRLRTRMKFVQMREESLEEKRLHYVKVVKAFESALALLGAT